MDAETRTLLRASLGHVLTEDAGVPLAQRLAALGWDEVVADDPTAAVWDSIRHCMGPEFEFDDDLGWLRSEFFYSRAAPIYGGSQEIQRTLVAQRVLGMPREP